jgi:uncharacterized membrane protein YozB (DUF420 family)
MQFYRVLASSVVRLNTAELYFSLSLVQILACLCVCLAGLEYIQRKTRVKKKKALLTGMDSQDQSM